MTKLQVVSLITKIDYEQVVKEKFISGIEATLFDSHKEFLSNPLLATIMLLTFEQFAEIPEKMHIFYQQAFETLFHRHDATKEMYSRERYTSFPVDEFKRYLGAFCLVTYLDQRFSFDEATVLKFLGEAFVLEGVAVNYDARQNFLKDLLMSVACCRKMEMSYCFPIDLFRNIFALHIFALATPRTLVSFWMR
jgi:hypothetical protein